jgi:diguanylate cyclase (GGDEF)-like protein/PAS domain S-box-containing protein
MRRGAPVSEILRILMLEDNPADAELIEREMRGQGLDFLLERVAEGEAFAAHLRSSPPDLVLSDYMLPRFNGLEALRLARAIAPDVPVILVAGSINEETAVECMKAGAEDYVLKNHLGRLPSAVRAALKRKRDRSAARESEARYRTLFNELPVGLFRSTLSGRILEANPALLRMLGFRDEEALLGTPEPLLSPSPEDYWTERLEREGVVRGFETAIRKADGSPILVRATLRGVRDAGGVLIACEGVLEDITLQKWAEQEQARATEALRDSETRLRLVSEQIPAAIWTIDRDLRFTSSTGAALQSMGLKPGEVVGRTLYEFFGTDDDSLPTIAAHRAALGGTSETYEAEWAGGLYEAHVEPLSDAGGEIVGAVGCALDVTRRRRAEEQLRHQAYHDDLTGLPNRLLFADRFSHAFEHARRNGRMLAMLLLDLDRFKTINDTLGHAAGDRLLQIMADRLVHGVRASDTVARFGGDEFMVLLSGVESVEDAARSAGKILALVSPPVPLSGQDLHVTTSIGVSIHPFDGLDLETLVKNADTALYRAKDQGRNCYRLYTASMNATALQQLALENDLRRAVERGELLLHYQPQVEIATGRVVAVEALVRWKRPNGELLLPDAFLPLAEDTGLILPIGEWILEEACRQARIWRTRGHLALRVAVNISAQQFEAPELTGVVSRILQRVGLEPGALELELTESAIMHNPDLAVTNLASLRSIGVRSFVDDFGVGYSSLSSLKRLPVDALKIDRSFVRDIMTDPDDAAIVRAIVSLGRTLKLDVVAEGVEDADQLAFLRTEGCDRMQGHLVSPPLSPDGLERFLERSTTRVS